MKKILNKIKEIWLIFWEADWHSGTDGRLCPSDKRWLLYWNLITCFGMAVFFLLVTGINTMRINRQNDKYMEKTVNMVTAYMAAATKDEYDDIAKGIRDDLVFSEYGENIRNYIQYIPNTAEYCCTCKEDYPARIMLVCTNTGQPYSLDLCETGESPDDCRNGTVMNFGYDEISQTNLYVLKKSDRKTGYAELNRGNGIVSIHRMKTLFCDSCIREILNTVEGQMIAEFVIFDTEKKQFYPIGDGMAVQIGDYSLETAHQDSGYKITINYIGE